MAWTENEILLNQRPTMQSRELFQAVCDELAKYYVKKGFKYTRSKPAITYQDKEIKLQIGFSSSRSNISGSHVVLEILPNIYTINPEKRILKQIFGEILEFEPSSENDTAVEENHNCNIWNIDEHKFKKILEFINESILPMIDMVKGEDGIIKFLEDKPKYIYPSLKGENVNSDFVPFCNLKFPDLNIEQLLSK